MRLYSLKRLLVGSPLPTAQARHERLGKVTGLAVFASDNLSSVAYATEEILRVLTVVASPQGASDYIVAKDNLGTPAGLTAGAALLIDYTLTVAVSVSAGVAALTSAAPPLYPYRVVPGVALVGMVAGAHLRGVRESGRLFAVPTYLFIRRVFLILAIR